MLVKYIAILLWAKHIYFIDSCIIIIIMLFNSNIAHGSVNINLTSYITFIVVKINILILSIIKNINHIMNEDVHFLSYLIIDIMLYESILSLNRYIIIMVFQHVMCYHIFDSLFLEIYDIGLV